MFHRYRMAGATARVMLVNVVLAAEWGVRCLRGQNISSGVRSHGNRQAGFGAFAAKAASSAVPMNAPLKPAKDWIDKICKDRDVVGKDEQPWGRIHLQAGLH